MCICPLVSIFVRLTCQNKLVDCVCSRSMQLISWRSPSLGWYKLNIEGACKSVTGMIACEGVIRYWNGKWIVEFFQIHWFLFGIESGILAFGLPRGMDREKLFLNRILLKLLICLSSVKVGEHNLDQEARSYMKKEWKWLSNTSTRKAISLLIAWGQSVQYFVFYSPPDAVFNLLFSPW